MVRSRQMAAIGWFSDSRIIRSESKSSRVKTEKTISFFFQKLRSYIVWYQHRQCQVLDSLHHRYHLDRRPVWILSKMMQIHVVKASNKGSYTWIPHAKMTSLLYTHVYYTCTCLFFVILNSWCPEGFIIWTEKSNTFG